MAEFPQVYDLKQAIDGFEYRAVIRAAGPKSYFVELVHPLGLEPVTIQALTERPSYEAALELARDIAESEMDQEDE